MRTDTLLCPRLVSVLTVFHCNYKAVAVQASKLRLQSLTVESGLFCIMKSMCEAFLMFLFISITVIGEDSWGSV